MNLLIKNGRVIDPVSKLDGIMDVVIEKGKIKRLGKGVKPGNHKVIEARGKVIVPGLIDMHTHLREPGREDEETILSGSEAAARGGFSSVCVMPNTSPVIDKEGIVEFIFSRSRQAALVDVYPIGAVTAGGNGTQLAEMGELKRAGVIALSDDGNPVKNSYLMRQALEYSKMFDIPIISHCEDPDLAADGVMNEGYVSTLLGLRGIPSLAEESMVSRDISLAELTGGRLHIAHLSCAGSVSLIKQAKKKGIRVTAETAPHYFTLTDEEVRTFDTNYKMNPPLRTQKDIEAIKKGLADGTIDVIATDHAPHSEQEKDVEFDNAPFGITGLETSLGLTLQELVRGKVLTINQLVEKMAVNPARILGLNKGSLAVGYDADITIIDLEREWIVKEKDFKSKSKNSPFIGRKLKGMAVLTISRGKIVYESMA